MEAKNPTSMSSSQIVDQTQQIAGGMDAVSPGQPIASSWPSGRCQRPPPPTCAGASRGVSLCDGHAAGGEQYHHCVAPRLGDQLDDGGSAHSPIYG